MPKKAKEVELWEGDEVETTGKLTSNRQLAYLWWLYLAS